MSKDFNSAMHRTAPLVFAFVLALAFLLLLVAFRSIVIALKAIVLNLLSVAAAFGVLVLVFQHESAKGILGFDYSGGVMAWLPVFLFVILFGLSMDYHVFILSRIREAYDRGMKTDDAIAHGIKSTAGVVTSAAIVMVFVFSIFGTLSLIMMKQFGVGLATAVLIDATIVSGVLLPATMKLLGRLELVPAAVARAGCRRSRSKARRAQRRARRPASSMKPLLPETVHQLGYAYRALALLPRELALGWSRFTLLLAGWPIHPRPRDHAARVPLLIALRLGVASLAQAQAFLVRELLGTVHPVAPAA